MAFAREWPRDKGEKFWLGDAPKAAKDSRFD